MQALLAQPSRQGAVPSSRAGSASVGFPFMSVAEGAAIVAAKAVEELREDIACNTEAHIETHSLTNASSVLPQSAAASLAVVSLFEVLPSSSQLLLVCSRAPR